MKLQYL